MGIESPDSPVTKLVELNLEGMSREAKTRAKNEAGRILVEEIQAHLDRSSSPVKGGDFKVRKKDGTRSILLEFGDMRDAIEFRRRQGDNIEVGIFKRSETPKAFGHNTDFRGHPSLGGTGNKRQFIPDENEDFKRTVTSRVKRAVADIREFDEARQESGEGTLNVAQIAAAFEATDDISVPGTTGLTLNLGALFPGGEDEF